MSTTEPTPAEAGERYATWVRRTGLADSTQAMYVQKVRAFLEFVGAGAAEYAEALTDEFVRDYAVRDFRKALMTEQKAAPATVEGYIAAIGSFYDYLGLGKPRVKRAKKPKRAPKSLDETSLRKVLRAAERRGPRDFAIAMCLFQTAVRVSELAALDTDDVWAGDRSGQLQVRHGKGGEARTVSIPAETRAALRAWLAVRRTKGLPELGPLWVSRTGGRLSVRRIQSLMDDLSAAAEVDVTPHMLRHTFARFFLETGGDLGALQEQLGHRNLSSTQVYTGASASALAEQAERVRIDL